MDKQDRGKFEPLTDVKPSLNANEEIDLKEKDSLAEPAYLEDKAKPEVPATSTADYANYTQPEKPRRSIKKPLIIVLALLILGGAGYWFALKPKPAAKTDASSSQSTATTKPAETTTPTATKISTTTKAYTSATFKLAFSYPDDWVVADAGGGVLSVKSPSLSLKNPAGQTVSGQVVFTIRDKTQKLTEFDKGNATATRDSLKITYTKPTQTQRANTYVSYLQFATTTTAGALDGIYITSDSGYKKGQAIPLVDVSKVDPNISITFVDSSSKAMSIADTMVDDTAFSAPLINLLESLSIN